MSTLSLAHELQAINGLYQQLLPTIDDLHQRHPEHKWEHLSDVDQSDGLTRMTADLIPNLQAVLSARLENPGRADLSPLALRTARTREIFAQARGILVACKEDDALKISDALKIQDALENRLLHVFKECDARRTPDMQAKNIEAVGRVSETPAKIRCGQDS